LPSSSINTQLEENRYQTIKGDKRPLWILNYCFFFTIIISSDLARNWRTLAKRLCQATQRIVYTLDLRNHGESQATPGCTSYLDYSSDVKHFIMINGLKNSNPLKKNREKIEEICDTRGGKVAMTLALESSISTHKPDSELIKKLIAVDISPAKGPISESFQIYIDGFKESNSRSISSGKEANQILRKYKEDLGQPIPINEFKEDRSVCDLITNRSLSGTTVD
ncbi:hypothetical protein MJO28_011338, partial [Puccinia striiformis f. sp. tritici]